jgi:hypothetical protein
MGSQIPRTRPGAYLALLLALLAGQAAQAEGLNLRPETWGKDWTREDTYRQVAVTALLIVDWGQTRWIAKHPSQLYETNHFLGEHPSIARINNYFAASILWHAAISTLLPPDWRKGWQYVWIGIELEYVRRNYHIGVKVDF